MGARATGLGYASFCLRDEWSLFNNIAGLATVDQISTSFTYTLQPGLPSFNRMAAVVAIPVNKEGVAGAGVFRFGDDLYNEHILSAGFANTFGLASLGAKINYIQYAAEGFGTKGFVTLSLGGIAELTPKLSFGAYITNINQPKVSSDGERLPAILSAGFQFTLTEKVLVTSGIEKDVDYEPVWRTGLEYKIYKKVALRTGFNINPAAGFAGVGFRKEKISIDYAYSFHPGFGATHQATVSCKLKRKQK
jgi:hypothetical protein